MSCVRSNWALKRCLLTLESLLLIVFTKQKLEQPCFMLHLPSRSRMCHIPLEQIQTCPFSDCYLMRWGAMYTQELFKSIFKFSNSVFFSDDQNQFIHKFKRMPLPYLKSVSSMYLYTLLKWIIDAENKCANVSLLRLGLVLTISIQTVTFQKSCYKPF